MSSTTLNHLVLSRAQFAAASELADAGRTALARVHLLFAADHALLALAARSAIELPQSHEPRDRFSIAARLADVGAAPEDVAPVLRDLDDDSDDHATDSPLATRLSVGFGLVQALLDAYLAAPVSAAAPPASAQLPLYGGAQGVLNARGAEAAARGLSRIGAVIRATFRR